MSCLENVSPISGEESRVDDLGERVIVDEATGRRTCEEGLDELEEKFESEEARRRGEGRMVVRNDGTLRQRKGKGTPASEDVVHE